MLINFHDIDAGANSKHANYLFDLTVVPQKGEVVVFDQKIFEVVLVCHAVAENKINIDIRQSHFIA